MGHIRSRIDNPVCKYCGTNEDLLKDKKQVAGFRSICNACNRKRQRIKRNGFDTGDRKSRVPVCKECGETDISKLSPDKKCNLGVKALCRVCAAKRMRNQRNKPHSKHLEIHKKSRLKLRQDILDAYGNKCKICGQSNQIYLQIDHIHGNGNKHRAELGIEGVYNDIKRQGFPQDKYQVLCANCHLAKTRGYDPYLLVNATMPL